MARVPRSAPSVPPLTGASRTTALPLLASLTVAPNRRTAVGETLLMTTTNVPGRGGSCLHSARRPAADSSMKGKSGSMKITSGWSRSSAIVEARAPPRRTRSSRAAADRFHPVTDQPAWSRFAAMREPIRPSPTNPTLRGRPLERGPKTRGLLSCVKINLCSGSGAGLDGAASRATCPRSCGRHPGNPWGPKRQLPWCFPWSKRGSAGRSRSQVRRRKRG